MPTTAEGIPITMCTVVCAVLSIAVFVLACKLSCSTTLLGPHSSVGWRKPAELMEEFFERFNYSHHMRFPRNAGL